MISQQMELTKTLLKNQENLNDCLKDKERISSDGRSWHQSENDKSKKNKSDTQVLQSERSGGEEEKNRILHS